MGSNVLYYPTISLPNGSWLRQALFYWNGLSSIVPETWDWSQEERDFMNSFLSKDEIDFLKSEKQYKELHPDNFVQEETKLFQSFKKELLESVESPNFQRFLRPTDEFTYESKLHADKINPNKKHQEIIDFFRERKYIQDLKSDKTGFPYYPMEETVSNLYMSVLAKYLAIDSRQMFTPSTDAQIYFLLNYEPSGKGGIFPCTNILFNNILPVPLNEVPLNVIIDFKKTNRSLLERLHGSFVTFETEIAMSDNWGKNHAIAKRFRGQLDQQIKELEIEMGNSRMQFIRSSLFSLIKTAAEVGFTLASPPISLGFGVIGSLDLVNHYYNARYERLAILKNSTVGYLYMAKRDEII